MASLGGLSHSAVQGFCDGMALWSQNAIFTTASELLTAMRFLRDSAAFLLHGRGAGLRGFQCSFEIGILFAARPYYYNFVYFLQDASCIPDTINGPST